MRKINVRDLQHHLKSVLDDVEKGEVIEVKRRNNSIARIIPIEKPQEVGPWPDVMARLDNIYGKRTISTQTSDIIYGDRD